MPLTIFPSCNVEAAFASGQHIWQSIGDDPFFSIRFGTFRKRYVVVYLRSTLDILDPKIYFDNGNGYSEARSCSFGVGGSFIFCADIGTMGLIRSLRVDPASCSCQFEFTVEAHGSLAAADSAIAARLSSDMAGAKVCDLGRLPRFGIPRFRLPFRPQRDDVEKFILAHYALSAQVEHPNRPFGNAIWLSIVIPVYNTPTRYLNDLVTSFMSQNVFGVELIISDDGSTSNDTRSWLEAQHDHDRIRIVSNSRNGGIVQATNAALVIARGKWITFVDHDDVIAPNALNMIARTLRDNPCAMFLYTDEVVVDDNLKPTGLMLKPSYDPILLSGVNYINHFSLYRMDRLKEIGFLRRDFDGSQDYDLLLRYLDGLTDETILHLPYPAYWWRRTGRLTHESSSRGQRKPRDKPF